jgi:hypothetical protein
VYFVSSSQPVAMMNEVVELLEKCGPTRTSGALQLELDVIGSYTYLIQHMAGTPGKARATARIAELSQNPSLRRDPWSLMLGTIYPKFVMLVGIMPMSWDGGKKVSADSVFKGFSMWHNECKPLLQSACDNAVGARKVRILTIL